MISWAGADSDARAHRESGSAVVASTSRDSDGAGGFVQPATRSAQEKRSVVRSRRGFSQLESDAEDDTGLNVGLIRHAGALEECGGGDVAAPEAP